MYYICQPTKIAIYTNPNRKSITQIQKELGCNIIINGGIYDLNKYIPYCWLRKDNINIHVETWSDFGYGWNDNGIKMDTSDNIGHYKNFISCVALIYNGKPIHSLIYPTEMGGQRGRTAIGITSDKKLLVFCSKDGSSEAYTPERLQTVMYNLGCTSALMLDSGSSSHCIMPNGIISPSKNRPYVQNYIAIWTNTVSQQENSNSQCPYIEPKSNIRWGSLGNGACWVQWQLNRIGNYNLDVDGLFFNKSVLALKDFQKQHGLVVDGICGPKTRELLR